MKTIPKTTDKRERKDLGAPAQARPAPRAAATAPLERKNAASGRETRSYALQIKAVGDDGTVEGYGSIFGVRDSYDDVIVAGAYVVSLAAHKSAGTMPAMLWQHDATAPIGVWLEMVEDAKGLRIKGKLALDTVKGAEAYALLKMGALNGLSIGFVAKQWGYDRDTDVRTLTEVDLWEVSLVTFPANEKARITGVKAADVAGIKTIRQAEQALRDAGFSADTAKAFLAEVKRIALDERDAHEAAAALKAANRLLETLTS
ncbi:HK97 family phage prohead protease [Massilia sp. BKSP1R2A-1]|uniref:HK97 family phage prohead protease n=1 Tax=Massilia sp. BKSP1R2A-1 TaxID=3422595 RepID=UPI003D33C59B